MTLSDGRIQELLEPFLPEVSAELAAKLGAYLDLLLKWNARTNLTAVRDPEAIVQRHFGESLFAGRLLLETLGPSAAVMDFGSGAGFPGVPMALLAPGWAVTLAESQGKKAAFLREVVRTLGLGNAEVWGERVESMAAERRFDAVALRAVDDPERALAVARDRVKAGGLLVELRGGEASGSSVALPGSVGRWVDVRRV